MAENNPSATLAKSAARMPERSHTMMSSTNRLLHTARRQSSSAKGARMPKVMNDGSLASHSSRPPQSANGTKGAQHTQ